jgi:hypothetical protein
MAEAVPLVQVCIKEMITDGVGTLWEHLKYSGDKEAPDYVLSIQKSGS